MTTGDWVTQRWRGDRLDDYWGRLTQRWRGDRLVDHRGAVRWRGGRLVDQGERCCGEVVAWNLGCVFSDKPAEFN